MRVQIMTLLSYWAKWEYHNQFLCPKKHIFRHQNHCFMLIRCRNIAKCVFPYLEFWAKNFVGLANFQGLLPETDHSPRCLPKIFLTLRYCRNWIWRVTLCLSYACKLPSSPRTTRSIECFALLRFFRLGLGLKVMARP